MKKAAGFAYLRFFVVTVLCMHLAFPAMAKPRPDALSDCKILGTKVAGIAPKAKTFLKNYVEKPIDFALRYSGLEYALLSGTMPLHIIKDDSYTAYKLIKEEGLTGLKQFKSSLTKHLWLLPGYLVSLALVSASTTTPQEFEAATKDFVVPRSDELIVIINAFDKESDYNYKNTVAFYEKLIAEGKNAVMITPEDYPQMIAQLKSLSATKGKITRAEFFGHGLPGAFVFGYKASEPEVPGNRFLTADEIESHSNLKGVFAKDARVRFFACMVGNGKKGGDFLKMAGENWFDQGGELAGGRLAVTDSDFISTLMNQAMSGKSGKSVRLPEPYSSMSGFFLNYGMPIARAIVPVSDSIQSKFFQKVDVNVMSGEDKLLFSDRVRRVKVEERK